ncbi:MAG: Lrp/AsnC ligand binding domain-containing protein [Thermoplasmatota archaeon]
MTKGYVMVQCGAGFEEDAFKKMQEFAWIKEVHPLFGEYDFILHVECSDPDELAKRIIEDLRNIKGISTTKTFLEASFSAAPMK